MRSTIIIFLLLIGTSFLSCEKTLPFETQEETDNMLVLSSAVVADTTLTVTVTRAFPLSEIPLWEHYTFWQMETSQDTLDYKWAVLDDARVEATVNAERHYNFTYDEKNLYYKSDYIPKEGDRVEVSVHSDLYGDSRASVTVPMKQPIEIIDHKVLLDNSFDGVLDESRDVYDACTTDTVMHITCSINDPSGPNYYRLIVRSVGDQGLYSAEELAYTDSMGIDISSSVGLFKSDIFLSDDPVFIDHSLPEGYGGWPPYFSNVFDDHLFDGQSLTFSVRIRERMYVKNPRVYVELQSLSQDFYYYLKSIQLYRIFQQSDYSEPVQIYSNVESGWGIVGGLSGYRQVVPF
jgi:hypothetical protein